jgi:AsmA protein
MKRWGIAIAALVVVAVLGLIAIPVMLDRNHLRAAIEEQIRSATGLDLVVNGDVEVSVFPGSYVAFNNIGLRSSDAPDAPMMKAQRLTTNLQFVPLLLQRFKIADVVLTRPQIAVVRTADGGSNWNSFLAGLPRVLKPGAEDKVTFSEVRLENGELNYRDESGQASTETISKINLSLAWPAISRTFAATGAFEWRGERIEGNVSFNDFFALLSGERSGLRLRLAGAPIKLVFDGTVVNRSNLMMEGIVTADSSSLRSALRWAGMEPPGSGGLGVFALKARANIVGPSVSLTNVNIELDKNVAEGVITYNSSGRQALQATLAAGKVDLTPYVSAIRLLASGARDWNRQLFDLGGTAPVDIDMRLSAAKVQIDNSALGRTALGINLRAGTLAISIGEAQVYGGIATGSFVIARSDADADIKAQLQFADVNLQSCASDLFGVRRLTGRGNLSFALEATGSSPFGLAQSLNGTASLVGHEGAITGFNVEQLLKRLERRPLSGGGNFRSGQTPFDTLVMKLRFSDGVATAQDIRIEGPTARITLTGTASVPAREFDLRGVAGLITSARGGDGFDLPFVVQGPWDDPLVFPDPESLIRRSPASAPLLDSVKDRKTRDAVRSVLERFTGSKTEPATETTSPDGEAPAAPEAKTN